MINPPESVLNRLLNKQSVDEYHYETVQSSHNASGFHTHTVIFSIDKHYYAFTATTYNDYRVSDTPEVVFTKPWAILKKRRIRLLNQYSNIVRHDTKIAQDLLEEHSRYRELLPTNALNEMYIVLEVLNVPRKGLDQLILGQDCDPYRFIHLKKQVNHTDYQSTVVIFEKDGQFYKVFGIKTNQSPTYYYSKAVRVFLTRKISMRTIYVREEQ